MALQFCSFASGSSGNCYLVRSEDTILLVDVGITGKRVLSGLEEKEIKPEQVNGILITHEHVDHVRSLRMIAKKAENAVVYSSAGTLAEVDDKLPADRSYPIETGKPFSIGDICVKPFRLSHDAIEPVGYSFAQGGKQITVITDTGCLSEEILSHAVEADLLVLEANHEVNILKMGTYPYSLKRRILGDEGHLSNETAGKCLCKVLQRRKKSGKETAPEVLLAHLSKENNTPGQAYLTIRNILFEEDFFIDKDLKLNIAGRDEVSQYIEV